MIESREPGTRKSWRERDLSYEYLGLSRGAGKCTGQEALTLLSLLCDEETVYAEPVLLPASLEGVRLKIIAPGSLDPCFLCLTPLEAGGIGEWSSVGLVEEHLARVRRAWRQGRAEIKVKTQARGYNVICGHCT